MNRNKYKYLYGIIAVGLVAIIYIAVRIGSPKVSTIEQNKRMDNNKPADVVENSNTRIKNRELFDRLASLKLNPNKEKNSNKSDAPLDDSEYLLTEEEQKHSGQVMNEIEEVYWQDAPKILDNMFFEEKVNYEWTKRTQDYLNDIFDANSSSGAELLKVDCRQTLCKVVSRYKDKTSLTELDQLLIGGPLDTDAHGTGTELSDGRIETTVYYSSPGGNPEPFFRMNERILAELRSTEPIKKN